MEKSYSSPQLSPSKAPSNKISMQTNDENRENGANFGNAAPCDNDGVEVRAQSMKVGMGMGKGDSTYGPTVQDDELPILKFVLMGDNSTGKTNLALRFAQNKFNADSAHTVGFEFQSKRMKVTNNLTIKAQLWDTAGQERYDSLTSTYLRGAVGILLVYDVTSRRTFENLDKWLAKIDESAHPNAVRALVGNKTDLTDKREVTTLEGLTYAKNRKMDFVEVSAERGENTEIAWRRLIMTCALSLVEDERKERLSFLGQGMRGSSMGNFDIYRSGEEILPLGWVLVGGEGGEVGGGEGGYMNVWTGETIRTKPNGKATGGDLLYEKSQVDIDQIDLTFANIRNVSSDGRNKKGVSWRKGGGKKVGNARSFGSADSKANGTSISFGLYDRKKGRDSARCMPKGGCAVM